MKPNHIVHAEQILHAMKASGLTPEQVAEALHTAIYLMGKGNNLTRQQMQMMFEQETMLLERSMVFVTDIPRGPKL